MDDSWHRKRLCLESTHPESAFSAYPCITLYLITEGGLHPKDLASLEGTCSFFRQSAGFPPDATLSMAELAALDMCRKRLVFKSMNDEEIKSMKRSCGGSWKLVLRFLKEAEQCYRRETCQAVAGPGHSVVVTKSGMVYTFGSNSSGQLGHGTFQEERRPRLVKSLQGVRIIQATAGVGRTMLISELGQVYTMGKDSFGDPEYAGPVSKNVNSPQLIESLSGIFAVQAAIGNFFSAVLTREGQIYTFSWGADARVGHQTDAQDPMPHLLKGELDGVPVVQIAAGYCYLLARTCQSNGMSVYSVGCGLGGKLGHGTRTDERYPRLIEHFQTLNFQAVSIAAGAWHAAAVGDDGRICTWGWGRYGCLGHGNEECESSPKVVEALKGEKAIHVATGEYTTFVVTHNGDVYSFGCGQSASLGHLDNREGQANRHDNILRPKLVRSLREKEERVVQISLTNSVTWNAHTFALTESNKLYAFGSGDKGQLGVESLDTNYESCSPTLVDINLNR